MRLGIGYRKILVKNTNTWRINSTLLSNHETTEEIKKCLEGNDNENTMTQNLWDAAKALLKGKFIAIQYYLKKQEKSQTNNLTPKAIRERRTKKPQSQQKERNYKDQVRNK